MRSTIFNSSLLASAVLFGAAADLRSAESTERTISQVQLQELSHRTTGATKVYVAEPTPAPQPTTVRPPTPTMQPPVTAMQQPTPVRQEMTLRESRTQSFGNRTSVLEKTAEREALEKQRSDKALEALKKSHGSSSRNSKKKKGSDGADKVEKLLSADRTEKLAKSDEKKKASRAEKISGVMKASSRKSGAASDPNGVMQLEGDAPKADWKDKIAAIIKALRNSIGSTDADGVAQLAPSGENSVATLKKKSDAERSEKLRKVVSSR